MRYILCCKAIIFSLIFLSCSALDLNPDLIFTQGVHAQIVELRESAEVSYYHLVEKGFFPLSYNNNLIIDSSLYADHQKEGMIILKLLEWLERQNDKDSHFLLERFNDLYALEFHCFITNLDLQKKHNAKILSQFQDLYDFGVSDITSDCAGGKFYPFRTLVSKLFLTINIVNESLISYEARKETLSYALNLLKKDALIQNDKLGLNAFDPNAIKKFVSALQVYAVKPPLVEQHKIRRAIFMTVVVLAVAFFIWKVVIPNKKMIWTWFGDIGEKLGIKFFRPIGRGLYTGIREAADPDVIEMRQAIDQRLANTLNQIDEVVLNRIVDVGTIIEDTVENLTDRMDVLITDGVNNTASHVDTIFAAGIDRTAGHIDTILTERIDDIRFAGIEIADDLATQVDDILSDRIGQLSDRVDTAIDGIRQPLADAISTGLANGLGGAPGNFGRRAAESIPFIGGYFRENNSTE